MRIQTTNIRQANSVMKSIYKNADVTYRRNKRCLLGSSLVATVQSDYSIIMQSNYFQDDALIEMLPLNWQKIMRAE